MLAIINKYWFLSKPTHSAGLVNSILFITTRCILPDTASLPQFTTPRNRTMSESEAKYGITPFSLEPTPANRRSQEADQRSAADLDDASLAHETVPAPSYTLGGISHGSIESSFKGDSSETITFQEIDRHGVRRQESLVYPDVITVPTLEFAYPRRAPTDWEFRNFTFSVFGLLRSFLSLSGFPLGTLIVFLGLVRTLSKYCFFDR